MNMAERSMPAMLQRKSTAPKRPIVSSTTRCHSSTERMSNASSTTCSAGWKDSASRSPSTSTRTRRIWGRRRRSSVAKCRPTPLAAPVMIATWSFILGFLPGSAALDDADHVACEWLDEPWGDAVQEVGQGDLTVRHRDDELALVDGLENRLRDLIRRGAVLGVEARDLPLDLRDVAAHDPGRYDRGVDDAGTDRADVDAALGELGVERLAEADDAVLRSAVGGQLGGGKQPRLRCGVHDRRRAALLEHPWDERLDAVGDAEQVHADDALPVFDGGRLDAPGVTDAGVVVEDVDVALGREHGLGEGLDRIGIGDVERVRHGAAAGSLDRACDLVGPIVLEVGHVDPGAVAGKQKRR